MTLSMFLNKFYENLFLYSILTEPLWIWEKEITFQSHCQPEGHKLQSSSS